MSVIANTLIANRLKNSRSIAAFLNCGDPDIETSYELIKLCATHGVDIIELGVPFANSFTDGKSVLRSHERALKNKIAFEDTLLMVKTLRTECSIPIVLLVDFSHSVKSRGIKYVVEKSYQSGIEGILIHGLPPLYLKEYIKATDLYEIDPVFSLYPNTTPEKMAETLVNCKGFIYLVSQYGRAGQPVDFCSPEITEFFSSVRQSTALPLMSGFGIKAFSDMKAIFTTSAVDGVIVGSAISDIIEYSLPRKDDVMKNVSEYLITISKAKEIGYKQVNDRGNIQ